MDLQTIFYIVAIVAFLLFIVFLIVAIYFIFFLKKIVNNTQKAVIGKIIEYTKPIDALKSLSSAVIANLIFKLKDNFRVKYTPRKIKSR